MRSKLIGRPIVPVFVGLLALLVPLLAGQEEKRARRRGSRDGVETVELGVRGREGGGEIVEAPRGLTLNDRMLARRWPFLLPRADGSTTIGSLQWVRGKGDQIVVSTLTPEGKETDRRLVGDRLSEIVRPVALIDAAGRARVFWTELVGDTPQLRTAREQADGRLAPPETLTGLPETGGVVGGPALPPINVPPINVAHINVEVALGPEGRIWLAWEQETPAAEAGGRGSRDVCVAPLVGKSGEPSERLGAPIAVGDGRFSDVDPGIVAAGGKLWIVWVGYGGRDYEVKLRSLDPKSGQLSEVVEVSADPESDDLHPSLAAAPNGDLWIAWDRIELPDRGDPAPAALRLRPRSGPLRFDLRVACVRDDRVLVPASGGVVPGAPFLSAGGGVPRIGVDAAGRVCVAYHELFRLPKGKGDYAFPVLVQWLGAEGWSAPVRCDQRATIPEEPALALAGGEPATATVAFSLGQLGLGVATIAASAPLSAPSLPSLIERAPSDAAPHFHPFEGRLDDPYVSGAKHFELSRGEERWRVYWGDLHRHSSVSRCSHGIEPGPADRWEWGRDVHLYDFMALTDHCGQMDPLMAWQLDKLCWLYRSPTFCTLAGWEWSSREVGHHNVILKGRMSELVGETESIDTLYARLPPETFITIPHHSADGKFPQDFTRVKDRFTRLVEVYQACRGNYEFDGCFRQSLSADVVGSFLQDALNDGHRFGIIASTDHGFGQSYACVVAKSLDRADVFDALHARRTYGATTKGMLVDFRIDDAVMGEELKCESAPRVRLHALAAGELADVTVFRNGRIWKTTRAEPAIGNHLAPLRLVVRLPPLEDRPSADWSFRVAAPLVQFEDLEDRRELVLRGPAPSWTLADGIASFAWPREYLPEELCRDFGLHVQGAADAEFVVTSDAGEQRTTFAALMQQPLRLESPGGACFLSIAPGDAAIDLAKGLGTREFDGEWVDESERRDDVWYYARLLQTDGEMAWSSPIFVSPP